MSDFKSMGSPKFLEIDKKIRNKTYLTRKEFEDFLIQTDNVIDGGADPDGNLETVVERYIETHSQNLNSINDMVSLIDEMVTTSINDDYEIYRITIRNKSYIQKQRINEFSDDYESDLQKTISIIGSKLKSISHILKSKLGDYYSKTNNTRITESTELYSKMSKIERSDSTDRVFVTKMIPGASSRKLFSFEQVNGYTGLVKFDMIGSHFKYKFRFNGEHILMEEAIIDEEYEDNNELDIFWYLEESEKDFTWKQLRRNSITEVKNIDGSYTTYDSRYPNGDYKTLPRLINITSENKTGILFAILRYDNTNRLVYSTDDGDTWSFMSESIEYDKILDITYTTNKLDDYLTNNFDGEHTPFFGDGKLTIMVILGKTTQPSGDDYTRTFGIAVDMFKRRIDKCSIIPNHYDLNHYNMDAPIKRLVSYNHDTTNIQCLFIDVNGTLRYSKTHKYGWEDYTSEYLTTIVDEGCVDVVKITHYMESEFISTGYPRIQAHQMWVMADDNILRFYAQQPETDIVVNSTIYNGAANIDLRELVQLTPPPENLSLYENLGNIVRIIHPKDVLCTHFYVLTENAIVKILVNDALLDFIHNNTGNTMGVDDMANVIRVKKDSDTVGTVKYGGFMNKNVAIITTATKTLYSDKEDDDDIIEFSPIPGEIFNNSRQCTGYGEKLFIIGGYDSFGELNYDPPREVGKYTVGFNNKNTKINSEISFDSHIELLLGDNLSISNETVYPEWGATYNLFDGTTNEKQTPINITPTAKPMLKEKHALVTDNIKTNLDKRVIRVIKAPFGYDATIIDDFAEHRSAGDHNEVLFYKYQKSRISDPTVNPEFIDLMYESNAAPYTPIKCVGYIIMNNIKIPVKAIQFNPRMRFTDSSIPSEEGQHTPFTTILFFEDYFKFDNIVEDDKTDFNGMIINSDLTIFGEINDLPPDSRNIVDGIREKKWNNIVYMKTPNELNISLIDITFLLYYDNHDRKDEIVDTISLYDGTEENTFPYVPSDIETIANERLILEKTTKL